MKAGSGKTLGLKQATVHASGIYDTLSTIGVVDI